MFEEYGGGGAMDDFRFNAVVVEEFASYGGASPAFSLQNDVVGPTSCTWPTTSRSSAGSRHRVGETILAVAMTEPGAGSDLAGITTSARRDGDDWILNGPKTFISSGINSDLVVGLPHRPRPGCKAQGVLAAVVERGMPVRARPASSTRSASKPRTPPNSTSTTSACRRRICWVRRTWGSTTSCRICRRSVSQSAFLPLREHGPSSRRRSST